TPAPVRTAEVHFRLSGMGEPEDPVVLEKAADDADDAHVVTEPWEPGAQAAVPPHHEVHTHPGARRLVEVPDQCFVVEGVHLGDDPPRAARTHVVDLAADQPGEG